MQMPSPAVLAGGVAANYAKRLLDQHGYDFVLSFALRNGYVPQNASSRNVLELLAYVAAGIGEFNMGEHSFLAKFVKEVISDIPSELAQRMHRIHTNPAQPAPPDPPGKIGSAANTLVEGLFPWTKSR